METITNRTIIERQWRYPLLALAIALSLLILIYIETVVSIIEIWWRSDTYAHGMLILPFSLYMIWTQRQNLKQLYPQPTYWGITFIIPSVFLWVIGVAVNILVIQQVAFLSMIWSILIMILGWSVIRKILYPVIFLIFMIPLGEGLIPILMDFTAVFTVKAIRLSGIPVYWEGLHFMIPSGSFEVAKACSGIRYLFASVALGCLFAYINYNSYKKRIIFVLFSMLLPLIGNGIRAYGIVMIAHFTNHEYAVGFDHLVYGWLFFGVIMFVLFYIGNKWREDVTSVVESQSIPHAKGNLSKTLILTIFMLISLSAGPLSLSSFESEKTSLQSMSLLSPQSSHGWEFSTEKMQNNWKPYFKGVSSEIATSYLKHGNYVKLYIGYYRTESQGSELINQSNKIFDITRWTEIEKNKVVVSQNQLYIRLYENVIQDNNKERLIWYWYDIDGFVTPSKYEGKLLQAWKRLTGSSNGDAIIVLLTDVVKERSDARELLNNYLVGMYPAIQFSLNKVRKER